ncbi:hypothetical protein B0T10DRAFT_209103 [Thelonectria olida]|uniref:Secreted protein n=1 Tax=Thelonectria olida TaxID=1576542 RepID=A0A9P8W9T0_9HYPO|nr:hypothetical protein B0T10DRAFT_209103 [Thelonectria olida]
MRRICSKFCIVSLISHTLLARAHRNGSRQRQRQGQHEGEKESRIGYPRWLRYGSSPQLPIFLSCLSHVSHHHHHRKHHHPVSSPQRRRIIRRLINRPRTDCIGARSLDSSVRLSKSSQKEQLKKSRHDNDKRKQNGKLTMTKKNSISVCRQIDDATSRLSLT